MALTQSTFYSKWPVIADSKEQRLVLDLRDSEFSWDEIDLVFIALELTPYAEEWDLQLRGPSGLWTQPKRIIEEA